MNEIKSYWDKEKWFLCKVLAPILSLFLVYQFVVYPILIDIQTSRIKVSTLSEQTLTDDWLINELKNLKEQVSVLKRVNEYFDARIVSDTVNVYSETNFRKLAEQKGLSVQKITEQVVEEAGVNRHIIVLSLKGNYKSFIAYLSAIETERPLAAVSSFAIKKMKNDYGISSMKIEFLKKPL